MTATEVLRRMLDERGVEWKEHRHTLAGSMAIQRETLWGQPIDTNGKPIPHVYHCRATEMGDGRLFLEVQLVTPEQAIAATLGPFKDQFEADMWDMFRSGGPWIVHSEYMKLKAEYDELKATLGVGTCHPVISDNLTESEGTGDAWADCSECGHLLFVLTDPTSEPPNYCPNCGAKVVEPTTNDVDAEVEQ